MLAALHLDHAGDLAESARCASEEALEDLLVAEEVLGRWWMLMSTTVMVSAPVSLLRVIPDQHRSVSLIVLEIVCDPM